MINQARVALTFLWKKTCTTCRRARRFLLEQGATFKERDLGLEPLDEGELDRLIGERDRVEFLNYRNELYRKLDMKRQPPSRAEAIALMAKHPNLIRRPILIQGKRMLIGWNEEEAKKVI